VPGDAMLGAGSIRFNGAVGQDYIGAAGTQEIAGTIEGSLRAAGGDVRVSARVGRNATIAGGRLELDTASSFGGNVYVAGGEIRVAGDLERMLHAAGGSVVIAGRVGGD